jgi:Collagen triple helix repeat (20 copies)
MAVHKDNKYSVNSRLNSIEAQLLELRSLIKSTLLVAGPVGAQGQTGASGADGKNGAHGKDGANGKDSSVPGPAGPAGRQGERGIRGEKGETGSQGPAGKDGIDGQSIVGPQGPKGDRGDCTIPNDSELAAAVLNLRKKHAAILAKIAYELELNGGRPHNGLKTALTAILKVIEIEAKK